MEGILVGTAVEYLAPVAVTILTGMVSWLLAAGARMIRKKTKNEEINNAISRVCAMTETTVAELAQTMAADLRAESADGKLSVVDAVTLRDKALRLVKERLAPEVLKEAGAGVTSINALIAARIERAVKEQKSWDDWASLSVPDSVLVESGTLETNVTA